MPSHVFKPLARLFLSALSLGLFCGLDSDELQAQSVPHDSLEYRVVMKSGDSFRGNVLRKNDSLIVIQTEFDVVEIPVRLIDQFIAIDGPHYRRSHHFLMPTASPYGPGGFISNVEGGFVYGGIGLGYGATVTAGASIVPGFTFSSQIYHVGAKFTVERSRELELSLGATYTFLTTREPYAHLFAVTTLPLGTGRWSGMLLYKVAGDDFTTLDFLSTSFGNGTAEFPDTFRVDLFYEGALGAAFGLDAPAFARDDMRWVAEIWNNDLTKPGNTVSMVGLRHFNEHVWGDFGLALFTAPAIVPVFSFGVRL